MKCVSWTVCQTLKNRLFVRFLKTVLKSDFRMTLKNGFGKCSLFVLPPTG